MQVRLLVSVALVFSGAWALAQEAIVEDEIVGYSFHGATVVAPTGRALFPVIGVDKKKIYVDAGIETKKVSLESLCFAQTQFRVSPTLLEVLEMDVVTSSMANLHRNSEMVAEMQRAQFQSEAEIAILKGGGSIFDVHPRSPARENVQRINEIQEITSELQTSIQEGLDSGTFEAGGLADTVYVEAEIMPSADVEGAYWVFALTFEAKNLDTGKPIGLRRVAKARYLGDLKEGKVFKLKKRFATPEFSLASSKYSLHVFSSSGEEVALSNSHGLKPLRNSDFERVRTALETLRQASLEGIGAKE